MFITGGGSVIYLNCWARIYAMPAVCLRLYLFISFIFVRDGIHSDADYNSTRVGVVVVVVVVVRIFTMG